MLGGADVHATIPVKDLTAAKKFYGDTLQLEKLSERKGVVMYRSGLSKVVVYESEFAGTNKATTASWEVKDVETLVGVLKHKGVEFELYDLPGVKHEGEVHVQGDMRAAWFKDPSGNILCIGTAL